MRISETTVVENHVRQNGITRGGGTFEYFNIEFVNGETKNECEKMAQSLFLAMSLLFKSFLMRPADCC